MTAKEYLWRVRDAERELKQLEQAYTQARADILHLKGIAYDADKVTGGKIGDLSDAIVALEGYAQRLNAKWDELITLRETAKRLIDTLKDGRYREVLTLRYLDGQSWEQVAVTMGYTYRGVTGLHGKALKVFGEINCS
jgi:hypothetical protein